MDFGQSPEISHLVFQRPLIQFNQNQTASDLVGDLS